jgi:hypothetical protein
LKATLKTASNSIAIRIDLLLDRLTEEGLVLRLLLASR